MFDKYSDSFNKGIIGVLELILSKNYVFISKYDNHVIDLISTDYGKPKKYIKNY